MTARDSGQSFQSICFLYLVSRLIQQKGPGTVGFRSQRHFDIQEWHAEASVAPPKTCARCSSTITFSLPRSSFRLAVIFVFFMSSFFMNNDPKVSPAICAVLPGPGDFCYSAPELLTSCLPTRRSFPGYTVHFLSTFRKKSAL